MDTVGSGCMSCSIPGMEDAGCIFLFGYNPADSHPIVARRIVRAKEKGCKIIVADPRHIETARIADLYLPIKNGCNVAFLNAFANCLVNDGLYDKEFVAEHTNGFDEWWETIKNYTPESVQDITGVEPALIHQAAEMYATAKPSAIIGWGMGVCQQKQNLKTVHTIASIACVAGQIGKPNSGLAPVRGQNNVQGSCDMGMLPNLYPGYQKVTDPAVRAKFAKAWGVPEEKLPLEEGYKLTDLGHLVDEGKVHCFYNYGEDPVQTEPDSAGMRKTLSELDLFICQDIFMTQTTMLADVILPATSWASTRVSLLHPTVASSTLTRPFRPRASAVTTGRSSRTCPRVWAIPCTTTTPSRSGTSALACAPTLWARPTRRWLPRAVTPSGRSRALM